MLHLAADSAVLQLLLQHGAEAWQLNGAGETVLTVVVARECWEAAKALLETSGAADGIQVCLRPARFRAQGWSARSEHCSTLTKLSYVYDDLPKVRLRTCTCELSHTHTR